MPVWDRVLIFAFCVILQLHVTVESLKYLSVCLSVDHLLCALYAQQLILSTCLPVCLPVYPVCMSVCLSVCMCVCVSVAVCL